jgi:hypothetical protein
MSISRSDDDGSSYAVSTTGTGPTASARALPLLGITVRRLGRFVDEHPGGRQSFAGLTMFKLFRGGVLDAFSDPTKPSLCERLQEEGDAGVGIATWFVSLNLGDIFLDFLDTLEFFFAGEPQGLDTVIWTCLTSIRPFTPGVPKIPIFSEPIQGIRQLTMVMSTWDNPRALAKAWCLWELYLCYSCGGRVEFALPRAQLEQLMVVMRSNPATFLDSIASLRSENSYCLRPKDQDEIFGAISAEVGFSGLDAAVRRALKEWMERLLRGKIEEALAAGTQEEAADFRKALDTLHSH